MVEDYSHTQDTPSASYTVEKEAVRQEEFMAALLLYWQYVPIEIDRQTCTSRYQKVKT